MEEMYQAWLKYVQLLEHVSTYEMRCVAFANSVELFMQFLDGLLTADEVARLYWGLQLR